MDSVYDKALKEKTKLKERLAEIERFLDMYEELAGDSITETEPEHSEFPPNQGESSTESVEEAEEEEKVRPRPAQLVSVIADMMRADRLPMSRGTVLARLVAAGYEIPGRNNAEKARYLGTIMWRANKVFENLEGRGYWLKGEIPSPPRGHLF